MVEKQKLNLGCGRDAKQDYLNVDLRKFEGVDIVADVRELKFSPNMFTEILAKDIIEHMSFEDAKKLLRNCLGWLKQKGILILHTQNMQYLASNLASGGDYSSDFHLEVLKWVYGSSGEGDTNYLHGFHRWGYSEKSLTKLLRDIGFQIAEAEIDCQGFGLYVVAFKP